MPNRAVVKLVENREFLTSTPEKTVRAVAAHMKSFKADAVLVVNESDGSLLGICTERDLNFQVLAEGLDPNSTQVGAVMTVNPLVIAHDKPFGHALHMMHEGGFRHLPVVDPCGRPIGVVSARDALGLEIVHFRSELEQRECLTEVL